MDRQRLAVFSFAVCVVSSGLFCFVLDKEWMGGLSTAVKIPMYMVLGTSSCFAISFSAIDTINTGCCTPDEAGGSERFSRAIVSSPSQIYAILSGSIAMGAVFGFMFGYLDVEDDDWKLVRFSTDQVIWCFPFFWRRTPTHRDCFAYHLLITCRRCCPSVLASLRARGWPSGIKF
jgi:hypothetical protein